MLAEQGKPFHIDDVATLCDGVSRDYVKKIFQYLMLRGFMRRTGKARTRNTAYELIRDEKPDPLYIHPSIYRKLTGQGGGATPKGGYPNVAPSPRKTGPSVPAEDRPETRTESSMEVSKHAASQGETSQASQAPASQIQAGEVLQEPASQAHEGEASKETAGQVQSAEAQSPESMIESSEQDTATPEQDLSSTNNQRIMNLILGGYHSDLASKIQRLHIYCQQIWQDRRVSNIQEGFLLLDGIRSSLRLYYLKISQAARDGLINPKEICPEWPDITGWPDDSPMREEALREATGEVSGEVPGTAGKGGECHV